jgi:hypothetical protein
LLADHGAELEEDMDLVSLEWETSETLCIQISEVKGEQEVADGVAMY